MSKVVDLVKRLHRNDKVFAKVKGYPHWPAKILSVDDKNPNNIRYHVYFYGTNQVGVVKAENVCPYIDNKIKYGKVKKNKNFLEAMSEIEKDLNYESQQKDSNVVQEHSDEELLPLIPAAEDTSFNSTSGFFKRKIDETHDKFSENKTKIVKNAKLVIALKKLDESMINKILNTNITSECKRSESNEDSQHVCAEDGAIDENAKSVGESDDCIFAKIDKNEKLRIPLNLNEPHFSSKESKAVWNNYVLLHANSIKNRIEDGEELDPYEEMDEWTKMKGLELRESSDLLGQELDKSSLLQIEGHLLDIDIHFRRSLNIVNPDFDACFILLDHLVALPITPLMLKKQPHIVAHIDQARSYVGSIEPMLNSDSIQKKFKENSEKIRSKSDIALSKFKKLFNVADSANFMDYFNKEVDILRRKTCSLTEEEFFFLSEEPE
uniref:PWWP domain-containing protein n=1 Tax=Rhodnius prolixus TaxID=13249 RepID=T1IAJ2_RHOPR